ncbi:hypothetical protein JY97_07905 [Alkalispirochaeta odontotermitis]|nr:hypothetical protein JY97_07905 [Alkalispirochaeta odontotermitis]CAB1082819.1 hypothetical protein D1AOALGA4SA_10415 [Olavius algarvensis Delta 1 endosymbiont]
MSSFEYKGKNVDQAVKKACEDLKVGQNELKYEILSYGSSGIFGFAGAKKARILVTLVEKTQELENELPEQPTELAGDTHRPADRDHVPHGDSSQEQTLHAIADNPLEMGRVVLQRFVDAITSDAKISAEGDSEQIFLKVAGGNAGPLIGKKGQTLDAMQSLVEKIVNKQQNTNHGHRIRVHVDVEGYLESRKANLEKLAMQLANKSKRISKAITLGQMNAYDRRIVHLALKGDPGVRTKSRGEGYLRKVVIFPKKNNSQRTQRINR